MTDRLEIDSARVDDPTMFEVIRHDRSQNSTVSLRALRVGTTKLHVGGSNGQVSEDVEVEIRAASPTSVSLAPTESCMGAPLLIGTNSRFNIVAERYEQDTKLLGTGGFFPLTSDVATADPTYGTVFQARATPGTGAIRSLVSYPSLAVHVFDLSEVTGVVCNYDAHVIAGRTFGVSTRAQIGPNYALACSDAFAREVVVTTPSTCAFSKLSGIDFDMNALAPGPCNFRVVVSGTKAESVIDLIVDSDPSVPFDAGAADATDDDGG